MKELVWIPTSSVKFDRNRVYLHFNPGDPTHVHAKFPGKRFRVPPTSTHTMLLPETVLPPPPAAPPAPEPAQQLDLPGMVATLPVMEALRKIAADLQELLAAA